MKIGLISFHSFFSEGGVKRHILNLKKEFEQRQINSKIICPRRKLKESYGSDVIVLGTSFPVVFGGTKGDLCINFTPFSIEKTLAKESFDVLHFHNFGFPLAGQILEESNSLNILTFHANLEASNFLRTFFQSFFSLIQGDVDGIIGVAPHVLKYFKSFKGPKTVIPNGINLKEFSPQGPKIKKFEDEKINILFLGRIEERKGLIYLLRAYKILEKKFSNLRLIIVGEGGLKKECEDYVRENKLKEVFFEGGKKAEEAPLYYRTADIFVGPSIFGESFGIVLLEAMASAKPVIAFANQGYKELLKGKKGAFLVPSKNYKALAKKIEVLVKNKQLRKKMGNWGKEEAKRYSWEKVSGQVLDFYQFCQKEKEIRQLAEKKKIVKIQSIDLKSQ